MKIAPGEAIKTFLGGLVGKDPSRKQERIVAHIVILTHQLTQPELRGQRLTKTEKVTKQFDTARGAALQRAYGISPPEWDAMFSAQGLSCAICLATSSERQWHTDHDHKTGRVRGILCHGCNLGIGLFRDRPKALRAAADYLERPNK